uniref:Uncharacterized protein n=1 Tax=Oryza glumipatula TaxID=40148 RepID=A0A0E0AC44_9ORYZ
MGIRRSCLPPPSHSDAGMYEYDDEVEEDYEEELCPASRARVDPPQPPQYSRVKSLSVLLHS